MKIIETFNFNETKFNSKEYNIFIPICLGNKFFLDDLSLTDNIKKYIEYSLQNTNKKILIIIVDKIQYTNHFVRDGMKNIEKSKKKVISDGLKIKNNINLDIENWFNKDDLNRIEVITYEEYENSNPQSKIITKIVREEFSKNEDFKNTIFNIVKNSIRDRNFSKEEYWKFCDYVLDEFALAYAGAEYKGRFFDLYIYPVADLVLNLIEDIKDGKLFNILSQKMPKKKAGVIILNK
jgi:hypothetical protein